MRHRQNACRNTEHPTDEMDAGYALFEEERGMKGAPLAYMEKCRKTEVTGMNVRVGGEESERKGLKHH